MKRRFLLTVALATLAATLAPALSAEAGAPNYECSIGSFHIGVDQHRRSGLSRSPGASVQPMPFVQADQNGSSLGLAAKLDGGDAVLDLRGSGAWATMTHRGQTRRGACAFIPGDFALGQVTAGRLLLRSAPDDGAAIILGVRMRSLVWSSGRFDEDRQEIRGTADWAHFRVVLHVKGGATDGGPQQIGMGQRAGLDGRSTIVEGWGRVADVVMLGPPGP